MHHHPDAKAVVRALAPDEPVICNRPHAAARAARFFAEKFPGKSMYAVKANPSPELLQVLWDAGVTHFDVASIAEVRLVRELLPEATLCFMHPVKTGERDRRGLFEHGVRTFSLDTHEELAKIVEATADAARREDLQPAGAPARVVRAFRAVAGGQVRHRSGRCGAAAAGDPPALRLRWASASTSAARR